tara:strand:+ start:3569 stop:4504 length:936 start_codon:yes stop_codon:yes gene_type:complete
MTNKKIIVQVSEGLGNQLFMYAHSLSLSKKLNYDLEIDNISSYKRKKNLLRNHQKYFLDHFSLNLPTVKDDFLINGKLYNIKKKILLFYDRFKIKKSFYIETKKNINSIKRFNNDDFFNTYTFSNKIYVLGNFENPNYFKQYRKELITNLTIKNEYLDFNIPYINELKDSNSISIHIRRNRFSDQNKINNKNLINKSLNFTNDTIEYINNGINYFNKRIDNPKYFIWSNDMNNIHEFTDRLNISNFKLIKNNDVINDFYLFKFSKHFIVGPSSFHWWGAWLNNNKNKICVRPSKINPSNNSGFWPEDWISI